MSGNARAEILARTRAGRGPASEIPRDYDGLGALRLGDPVGLFAERVADYRAGVLRCPDADLPAALAGLIGGQRFAVAPGFPTRWAPPDIVIDDPPLSVADLDRLDGVLTTCAVAIATTGTIVLDHTAGQGRRALTLVPDRHVVLVRADQILAAVPDAIAALNPTRPLTWISGPSATSDIELNRVEGVHGPRTLDVVIIRP